jgi:hypothetical protein
VNAVLNSMADVSRTFNTRSMSDAERELHIRDCGWLMEDAMRRYCETGCFSYRGEADHWKLLMNEAIRGRSPAQVAKMERELGLA